MVRDNDPATMNDFQEPVDDVDGDIQRHLQEFNPPQLPPPRICSENAQDHPSSQFAVENGSDQAAETDHQEPVHYEDGEIQRHVQKFNSQDQPQPQSFSRNSQELPSRQFAVETYLQEPVGLTGLPPVNEPQEDVHGVGPSQAFMRPFIPFYTYPYPSREEQLEHFRSTMLELNPQYFEQSTMPANPENPPQLPVKRTLPAPQRGDSSRRRRRCEKLSAPKNPNKDKLIPPPFPWATERRATVHDLETLAEKGIESVSGEVCCAHCEKKFSVSYNIVGEFAKLRAFVEEKRESFHDRAPSEWTKPALPDCMWCGWKNCIRPVIADKKRRINWLFLLLGSLLGHCSLEQLKYFCKHTLNHRTGAKDRLLYLTYLGLCKQLDKTGPFDAPE